MLHFWEREVKHSRLLDTKVYYALPQSIVCYALPQSVVHPPPQSIVYYALE